MSIELHDVIKFIRNANFDDLLDVSESTRHAIEAKQNESRTRLLEVTADGMGVGYFREGETGLALEYLLENKDTGFEEVRISAVRIRDSEVEEKLANHWWSWTPRSPEGAANT